MGCCCKKKKKDEEQLTPTPRRRSCLTVLCTVVLFMILIINVIWGFGETMSAVVINFVINHPVGKDGFSNFHLEIRDITYIDRKAWDDQDDAVLEPKVLAKRTNISRLREIITYNCTLYDEIRTTFDQQACNTANDQERKFDYYCAVVEHPEVYFEAFQPLVFHWLVYNCIFVMLIPIKLVSTCWTSQVLRLLGVYMALQIIPIGIAISIVYTLFPIHLYSMSNETSLDDARVNPLCALDYLHEGLPIRKLFGYVVAARFGLKALEALCIVWYIFTHKAEKRRLALGIPISPKMKQGKNNRVAPSGAETPLKLEPITDDQVELALAYIEKEQEKEELAKKAAAERNKANTSKPPQTKSGTSLDHLPMDAILPAVNSPKSSREKISGKILI